MIQNLLSTEIVIVEKISDEEARQLEKQLELSELALKRFLKSEINFSDYLEIMKMCQINIDDYLIVVQNNLSAIGIHG
jgi:hypothetical protein